MKCDVCSHDIQIGDWPYCPHGAPHGMHTFKPYIDENMLDHPVEITSWAQRQRLVRENGLIEKERPSNSVFAERRDRNAWFKEVIEREAKHAPEK
jgi:hypothetical protein